MGRHEAEPPCFKSNSPPSRAKNSEFSVCAREGGSLHFKAWGFSPVSPHILPFSLHRSPLMVGLLRHGLGTGTLGGGQNRHHLGADSLLNRLHFGGASSWGQASVGPNRLHLLAGAHQDSAELHFLGVGEVH